MKTLLVAAALGLTAIGAMAQGQFTFGNRVLASGIDAPIKDDKGVLIAFDNFVVQPWFGMAADSLAPVGTELFTINPSRPGYISTVLVTTTLPGKTAGFAAIAAWEKGYASMADAEKAGKLFGISAAVPVTLVQAPDLPGSSAAMVGLQGFSLAAIPEPSTLALGVLGLTALFLRRRS